MVILTAAGHGGADSGTSNLFVPGSYEKDVNLAIEGELARFALANGHQVFRMRTTDTDWALSDLSVVAQRVKADAVFEVHCNASGSGISTARGAYAIALPNSRSWMVGAMIMEYIQQTAGIPNRGCKDHFWYNGEPLYVSNVQRFNELSDHIHMITENGYLSNQEDARALMEDGVRTNIGWSHLAGLHRYFGLAEPRQPSLPAGGVSKASILMVPVAIGFASIAVYELVLGPRRR